MVLESSSSALVGANDPDPVSTYSEGTTGAAVPFSFFDCSDVTAARSLSATSLCCARYLSWRFFWICARIFRGVFGFGSPFSSMWSSIVLTPRMELSRDSVKAFPILSRGDAIKGGFGALNDPERGESASILARWAMLSRLRVPPEVATLPPSTEPTLAVALMSEKEGLRRRNARNPLSSGGADGGSERRGLSIDERARSFWGFGCGCRTEPMAAGGGSSFLELRISP
mmetsp:Transcript_43710/g.85763  ORF Transcript_43710/g.85763 Transcript_43710/m.85763 type:complete len:228 (-) Transcript_43710:2383-3066(-)